MAKLRKQFEQALNLIEINGQKLERAIEAHTEIRELLQQDEQLKQWGIEPLLTGSYGRQTGIYPGKDVDIFLRFTELDTKAEPKAVYDAVWRVIVQEYGQYGQKDGRAQQQARSIKVLFPDHDDTSGSHGDFSVDAVPAVRDGKFWAIPTKDQNRWVNGEGRWITTGAVLFGDLSKELNQAASSPMVGDRHAYKPMVKLVRQIREVHLGETRPGGLYLEFVTFETWHSRLVTGSEWDDLLARTLQCIADRFGWAGVKPLLDPVLGTPVDPPLSEGEINQAAVIFGKLAGKANRALDMNNADAAAEWRKILGGNERADPVFPNPPNTGGHGGGTAAVIGTGVATRRHEAPRFG